MSHELLSGVVINQNQKIASSSDSVSILDSTWRYQDFFLPSDYIRGTNASEQIIPDLTGFQLLVGVTDAATAHFDWVLEYKAQGVTWTGITSGSFSGAHTTGDKVWVDFLVEEGQYVELSDALVTQRFRIGIRGSATSGVSKIWLSSPNPQSFANKSARAYDGGGPIQIGGADTSFCFRVLGLTADEGTDFLGNKYRSAVILSKPDNINTLHSNVYDKIWMSKPNPSRFAVENLYFDVKTSDGLESVIDNVLVDPVTPGVWFNIYYSSDGGSVTTEADWDNKLWTRIPKLFHATKRDHHKLPNPISAKFIKIEFTHLQSQHYAAGSLTAPINYKKHPKWVLDYFLAQLATQNASKTLISGNQAIIFDAYDLAYNYYLDDIKQEPDTPVELDPSFTDNLNSFLRDRSSYSDQMDPVMSSKIKTVLTPYVNHPVQRGNQDSLLTNMALSASNNNLPVDYPVEYTSTGLFPDVIELRNSQVVFENQYPVMFFYLTCRHRYRELSASLSNDRAYFVGVREIAFTRDNYSIPHDDSQYTEVGADFINAEFNDFTSDNGVLVV